MDKSTISNIYYSDQTMPAAHDVSEKYKSLLSELSDNCCKHNETLDESQKTLFDEINSQQSKLEDLACLESFSHGLKMGIKLIFEVFND